MSNEPFDPVKLAYDRSCDVVHTNLRRATRMIDEEFGQDYARNNPTLVAAFIQAATAYVNHAAIANALLEVSNSIDALDSGTTRNWPVP
jgi:hypothetical protein